MLINNILSKEINNGDFIQTSIQYLQQLKCELENNETNDESNKLQKTVDLSRINKEVQKCYEKMLEEKSKKIKNQMDENNRVTISHRKLTMKHTELICKLENSKNNVRRLQKEVCILQDKKSKLENEILEKEKLHAVCEGNVCEMRCKLDECSKDNQRMTKNIAALKSDLRCKTTELDDERLCLKRLKDTIEKDREERCAIEWKLKCCQLKQEADENKECQSNENKLPKPCCKPIDDELCCLKKQNHELQMEIERKNSVINRHKNKYNEAKSILKQIKLSRENCCKLKYEPLCVDKCLLKLVTSFQEKCCKPKCEDRCCTMNRVEKQLVSNICCMKACCNPSAPCCKPSKPCCDTITCTCKTVTCTCKSSAPCCKPSKPCCNTITCTCKKVTCTCKPNTPCCKPSKPCCNTSICKVVTCTCKKVTCICKPSALCCKPSKPCCKPSKPCCNTITCTCKTVTCTCKSSAPCCNTITCNCKTTTCTCTTTTCTCKPSAACCNTNTCNCTTATCTCKLSAPCCKPSTPCCKPSPMCCYPSLSYTKPSPTCCKPTLPCCKPSSCCRPSTPCCNSSTCTCKTSAICTCKTSTCCSSSENTIPLSKCKKIITDEDRYTNQLKKNLVELKNLKIDVQQLSKIK